LIAPFFALLGQQTWVAKLPNLFVMLGLAWAVFALASRLWDRRAGLLAGLLTLVHPYFFNAVLYPINDIGFTLIFFLLAWLMWQQTGVRCRGSGVSTHPITDTRHPTPDPWLIGVLAVLPAWGKPSCSVLLIGLGIWVLWRW